MGGLPDGYIICPQCGHGHPANSGHRCDARYAIRRLPVGNFPVVLASNLKTKGKKKAGPNATEQRYRDACISQFAEARYEAVTFRLANGHRYTPDWIVLACGKIAQCHEVKGGYRMHSHGRARLAFDQAKIEWPGIKWVWAQWNSKMKTWEIE